MDRKQLKILEKWIHSAKKKPLILRGARQVGKSTLVSIFADEYKIPYTEVNLERHPNLSSLFETKQPEKILDVLEALPNVGQIARDGLLFLDEIQSVPEAIPALRYFYEDMPELSIVSAGSLLEFALSDHKFSMPVGRTEYLHMGPMTFTEFLEAVGEQKLKSVVQNYSLGSEINTVVHERLLELTRVYFFVGGMPEAVDVYASSKKLSEVSRVHSSILETYQEDFPKYIGSRSLARIRHVFNFAARNVGNKVKYSHFSNQDQSSTIKADIELLRMARILTKVVHSHCSGLPLQADIEEKIYKLLFLDIGLMNAICGLTWDVMANAPAQKLVNEGAIAEQFVGQHLLEMLSDTTNKELNYWLREGTANNAEIDFVIAVGGKIVPIEIKAGAKGSLKSLHQFAGEKSAEIAVRFDANLPSTQTINTTIQKKNQTLRAKYTLHSLPLYLAERLNEILCD